MVRDDVDLDAVPSDAFGRTPLGDGRLGTYTLLGAACGVVPLPWLPDATIRRVRGALVHDVLSRHGLSVTAEARTVLADPNALSSPKSLVKEGVTFALTRVLGRFGPLGFVPPVRTALGTFVLGHLLQRYLDTARNHRASRVEIEEAKRVRRAIDQALLYAITTDANSSRARGTLSPEDLRPRSEQVVDGILISLAGVPSWLLRRLDAAFDDVISSVRI